MRRYIWAIALLLFCLTAQAADYYHLTDYVTTKNGSAISGASVNVYAANTTTTATAYTDFGGTIPVSWPLATDPNGMFECYLAQGNYDISITHSGRNIDTTWDNYMVGTGSDTLSYSSLDIIGTIAAEAFDASDWIDAGGTITGETVETTGLSVIGGTFTTGGTVTVGGDLFVNDQAQFAYDAVEEVYNFRVGPNVVTVEPYLEVKNDAYIYGNMYLHGKDLASGKVQAQVVAVDTLKPRTGDDIYVRAAHGQDDAILHTQFLELDPVDVTVSLPDAGLHTKGTFFLGTDDTLRFKNDAGDWATFGTSYVIPDPDVPVLSLPTTTLNYAYADSHVQKFGVGNSGDGILPWASDLTPSSTWIAAGSGLTFHDGAADSGYVGAGFDSVTIQLMWAQIDSGASLWDTVAVTSSYGNGEVVIHAEGQPLVGGGDYVVEPNHPRVLVNENNVAALRTKCKSAEASMYDDFIGWVNTHTVLDTYPLGSAESHGVNLQRLAFAHLVEQDTTGTYDYFELARECADSMFANWGDSWGGGENVQRGLSLFYDWCYDDMTAWGRGNYGDSLALECSRNLATANWMTDAPHSQMDWIPEQTFMAFAIAGDGLVVGAGFDADSVAVVALDTMFAHTFGDYHVMACFDSIARDGGTFEGDVYGAQQMADQSEVFWLWDYATDYDSWSASTNMAGNGAWIAYNTSAKSEVTSTTPPYAPVTHWGFGGCKQGDDYAHISAKQRQMLLTYRLSSAYDDSVMIWLSDQYDAHTNAYINNFNKWMFIIPKDTLMVATAPSSAAAGYASAKRFDEGAVFMREGWDLSLTSTDIWATYRHDQFPYNHAHADAGHFIIGRGHDLLFIGSGGYAGVNNPHSRNYFKHTVSKNSITIKHFGEDFCGYENSGGQQRPCGGSASQPATVGAYTESLATIFGDRGKITDYVHRPDTLTYIRSDLTKAYWVSKVDTVRREFVWMEPDDVFIIYDYVYATEDTLLQKSLFHTINNPTENVDDTWTVVHGGSEATLTFFGNASAQEIGGVGAEFEVNGTNYPYVHHTTYSDLGAYRIEALPTRSSKTRALITIIETSAVGGADYGTVAPVAVGDYLGAVVNGDTLLFSKYGGTYQYRAQ